MKVLQIRIRENEIFQGLSMPETAGIPGVPEDDWMAGHVRLTKIEVEEC